MLSGDLKAAILLNTEPEFDSAAAGASLNTLCACQMVVTLSPFKANMGCSDVLLPIAPFTETPGTYVNAEGRVQSFHAVVKPLGETRPAWKVMRVLANLLNLPGFDFESTGEILTELWGDESPQSGGLDADRLDNASRTSQIDVTRDSGEPVVASIYALDGIVRRASSLQMTADAALNDLSASVTA
jgi:NADH-quinone oxidoreductase subunit G